MGYSPNFSVGNPPAYIKRKISRVLAWPMRTLRIRMTGGWESTEQLT